MDCLSCFRRGFAAISRGAAKAAAGRIRAWGLFPQSHLLEVRLAACRTCHLCTLVKGKAYCGRPFLRAPLRDDAIDGCGCPITAKAADPREHCPIRSGDAGPCDCKWCRATALRKAA